ncbi:MAG: hypothetical protein ACXWJB_15145, partial [Limisphaerales bacterium]
GRRVAGKGQPKSKTERLNSRQRQRYGRNVEVISDSVTRQGLCQAFYRLEPDTGTSVEFETIDH